MSMRLSSDMSNDMIHLIEFPAYRYIILSNHPSIFYHRLICTRVEGVLEPIQLS